jgi:tetratricopeptide (TPR) repeat protein
MGKKSKRNRANSKKKSTRQMEGGAATTRSSGVDAGEIVAESRPRANTASSTTTSRNRNHDDIMVQSFMKLGAMKDYEGALKLESDMVLIAEKFERTKPAGFASGIYFGIAEVHYHNNDKTASIFKIAQEDKVIRYLEKSFELLEKVDGNGHTFQNQEIVKGSVKYLVNIYLRQEEKRFDEAIAIMKRLTACLRHDLIEPALILGIVMRSEEAGQIEKMISILKPILDTIGRSWDKEEQYLAYRALGLGYLDRHKYEKSVSFFRKGLCIVDSEKTKVELLSHLGSAYVSSCDCSKTALNYLHEALDILSNVSLDQDWLWIYSVRVHTMLGELHSHCDDQEALQHYERALSILTNHHDYDAKSHPIFYSIYGPLGDVYARLGNWDKAIEVLDLAAKIMKKFEFVSVQLSLLHERIASVQLDRYCSDERLLHDAHKRRDVLQLVGGFALLSLKYVGTKGTGYRSLLVLAQQKYFIGKIEEANNHLCAYLGFELNAPEPSCRSCHRKTAGKGRPIETCRGCEVADYCCPSHQRLEWRRGRLSHKVMCPFLKRWRKLYIATIKNRPEPESFEYIAKEFFETVCVLKYKV